MKVIAYLVLAIGIILTSGCSIADTSSIDMSSINNSNSNVSTNITFSSSEELGIHINIDIFEIFTAIELEEMSDVIIIGKQLSIVDYKYEGDIWYTIFEIEILENIHGHDTNSIHVKMIGRTGPLPTPWSISGVQELINTEDSYLFYLTKIDDEEVYIPTALQGVYTINGERLNFLTKLW